MKTLEDSFQTNADQTGLHLFEKIKTGRTLPTEKSPAKNCYIYRRTRLTGKLKGQIFGYEVVIPHVKKAGTYKCFDAMLTYDEDFEEYPGGKQFGFRGWYCGNLRMAEMFFAKKTTAPVEEEESPEDSPEDSITEIIPSVKVEGRGRGRPRKERHMLSFPSGEWSVNELAAHNQVSYNDARTFVKENPTLVKYIRDERRNVKGKATQIYTKA